VHPLSGRILVATGAYPPIPGGSSVIMKNLLDAISPESIVLARSRPPRGSSRDSGPHKSHFVIGTTNLPNSIERYRHLLLRNVVAERLVRLVREHSCRAILGVYPTILFLDVAERAARKANVPFIPYLHDTVLEGMSAGRFAAWGREVQVRVFESAARIFVATEGMAELFSRKYGLDVNTVLHIYPEPIPQQLPGEEDIQKSFFWGGAVYGINAHSLVRINRAIVRLNQGCRMVFATNQGLSQLMAQGIPGDIVDKIFIPLSERSRYLEILSRQDVLVLALSWPDETDVHEDELSTIFPTKAPEYLASGRPILVHCPEHYYLARFFRQHGCGEVVADRSPGSLEAAVSRLSVPGPRRDSIRRNALKAAKLFTRNQVVPQFFASIQEAIERRKL